MLSVDHGHIRACEATYNKVDFFLFKVIFLMVTADIFFVHAVLYLLYDFLVVLLGHKKYGNTTSPFTTI